MTSHDVNVQKNLILCIGGSGKWEQFEGYCLPEMFYDIIYHSTVE